jgi:hypothetical protein
LGANHQLANEANGVTETAKVGIKLRIWYGTFLFDDYILSFKDTNIKLVRKYARLRLK